jgi:2,3,4,5-tetrahydropyridine-2-carboxylate N-succinyltransferase
MTDRTAWGHGLATVTDDGTVLDTWYPSPSLGSPPPDAALPPELLAAARPDVDRRVRLEPVTTVTDLDAPPTSTPDAYLRLHLLSHLLVAPNTVNLDGLFPSCGRRPGRARPTTSRRPGRGCARAVR